MCHVLLTHQYIGPILHCCHTILVMQLILAIFCCTDLQYIPCLVCSEIPESQLSSVPEQIAVQLIAAYFLWRLNEIETL